MKVANITTVMNDSMRRNARRLKMTHEEYEQHLRNRVEEMHKNKNYKDQTRDKSRKITRLEANNPVLIVGAGPSWKDNIEHIKKWQHKLVVVDILFNEFVKLGIHPDYVITLEANMHHKMRRPFIEQKISEIYKEWETKPKFIGSSWTHNALVNFFNLYDTKIIRWFTKEEPRMSNVGLFALCYTYQQLGVDKIILVGFEHEGCQYHQSVYDYWITDFYYFAKKMPKETIINTSGGRLYGELILDANLGDLVG